MKTVRWQNRILLVLGIWLICSPFVLGYASLDDVAAWNAVLPGVAVAVFAVQALGNPEKWEQWMNVVLVLGLWLVIAPLVLRYYKTEVTASWNEIILGVLVGVDAVWALLKPPPASRG